MLNISLKFDYNFSKLWLAHAQFFSIRLIVTLEYFNSFLKHNQYNIFKRNWDEWINVAILRYNYCEIINLIQTQALWKRTLKSKYWSTYGSWLYWFILILKSTICNFAWQKVSNGYFFYNNYAYWILGLFREDFRTIDQTPYINHIVSSSKIELKASNSTKLHVWVINIFLVAHY